MGEFTRPRPRPNMGDQKSPKLPLDLPVVIIESTLKTLYYSTGSLA